MNIREINLGQDELFGNWEKLKSILKKKEKKTKMKREKEPKNEKKRKGKEKEKDF